MFLQADQLRQMTGALAFAAVACLGAPAFADELANWNAQRARLFSDVCMKSAPSFADFEARAVRAGFKRSSENGLQNEFFFAPDAVVSLQSSSDICQCSMTVGAPDQNAMAAAILKRLVADFPKSAPQQMGGALHPTLFHVNGANLFVQMTAKTENAQPWVFAKVFTKGVCPQ